MTLYEEAGISHRATAEEIRLAYHNLVRLLHPDAVRDPALQALAEAQLRRINAVFEVLNDAKRRADYDEGLNRTSSTNVALSGRYFEPRLPNAKPSLWGVALIAAIAVLFWASGKPATQAAASTPTLPEPKPWELEVPSMAQPRAAPQIPIEVAQEIRQLRRELRAVREELPVQDSEPFSVDAGTEPNEEDDTGAPSPVAPLASLAAPAKPAPPAQSASRPSPAPASLAGTWLYAQRAAEATRQDWYPPDFIELKIQTWAGGIAGRYQARYRVGDKPISPEIRFRFEGKGTETKGESLSWVGANGARGEVRLRQASPLTLQVDWVTTQAGTLPSLMSGSSLLVRSPE